MDTGTKVAIALSLLGVLTWLADWLFGEDIKAVSRHGRISVFLFGLALVLAGLGALWWWPAPLVTPVPVATPIQSKPIASASRDRALAPPPMIGTEERRIATPLGRRADIGKSRPQMSPPIPQEGPSAQPLNEDHSGRRFLTVAEKRDLLTEIVSLKPQIPNIVINRASSGDSGLYMMDFVDVFERAGITVVTGFEEPSGPEETGVMIAVPDLKNIPTIAAKIRRALAKTGVETRIVALPSSATQSSFVIFVGPEPLPSDDEKHKPQKPECASVTSTNQSGGVTACNVDTVNQ